MAERKWTVSVAFPSLHPSPTIKSIPAVIKKKNSSSDDLLVSHTRKVYIVMYIYLHTEVLNLY